MNELNYIRHDMTAKQALAIMLRYWRRDVEQSLILIAPTHMAETYIKNIRVALAKERSKYKRKDRPYYGFTVSEVFPYSEAGIKGEAIIIRWRLTQLQNFRNTLKDAMQFNEVI